MSPPPAKWCREVPVVLPAVQVVPSGASTTWYHLVPGRRDRLVPKVPRGAAGTLWWLSFGARRYHMAPSGTKTPPVPVSAKGDRRGRHRRYRLVAVGYIRRWVLLYTMLTIARR